MIGETISQYQIIDQLGEGGMGVVYLAEDTTLGRRVAMKFLSTTTKEYRARFLREARAVSALTHPNIATVFNYGETPEGQPYIVMELIRGESLSDKLRAGSLPLPEAVRIVSYIAEALGEAHHQGVVHRDVKPSNVIITERGQVKVLDFGLVKQIGEHSGLGGGSDQKTLPSTRTRSDVIVGTPLYLSPEQATGKSVDGRSDLFALGAVLYECITGQSAFAGASLIEIGAQVIHVTPVVPSKLNDRIPRELDRITMKAIEKKVEARYQSADELIEDLRQLLPTLDGDGYRKGRGTGSLTKMRTNSASALTTITETFRRPGPSLGTFVLAILAVAIVSWVAVRWWKSAPYEPAPAVRKMYDQGTDAIRNGAFLQATKALEQATASDPKFALAHARLAEAWTELDSVDRAKDEMLKAQPLGSAPSQFARLDALYLEAIHATVTRDYPVAIRAYTELVRLSPNNPQVYVDLGRAYEKNEELKKAIESYIQATNRDAQYPTPFLRVAILYGRQGDEASARATFGKADELYQALGNFEGQTEVFYQRGYLFNQLNNFPEARQNLQRALDLARSTANEYQQVKTLLKLGDVEADTGKLEQSRQYIREALMLAQAKGIDNLTKRGLVDLGNNYYRTGDFEETEKYFKQSLDLSQSQKDPRNAARALLSLGSLAEHRNKPDEVVQYVEQALPFYQKGDYRKESIQARLLLARARVQKGDYDVALQSFEQALELSQSSDPSTTGLAHENIGLLFIRQGRYPEALPHFEESYAIAKSVGDKRNVGLSLVDRANVLWRLGNYDSARAMLAEASTIAESSEATSDLKPAYHLAMARLALSERNFPEAAAKAQQAITLAGTQQNDLAIPATFTLGLARAFAGAASAGQLKCRQAVEMARQSGDPGLLSEALLSLAEAMIENGNSVGALENALESETLFARSGKADREWLALLIAARASRSAGDSQKASEYSSDAKALLAALQQKWGNDNYNSYLNRPDVKFSRKQLSEFIAGTS
ncbi:MAG TPA: tetratricopeptide repeat protein [Pyrinomonadaceae bacterium]|jgi:tetratricopeptide (TPR) repeat protein